MLEIDAHFDAYEHLKHLPREDEALHTLRKVASMVKPIMRKRGWKVGTLCEFLPEDPRLQGLNINRSERICVRLRYTPDPRQFIPLDHVIDTMLHELSHIVRGPHDEIFHAQWNELRAEYQSLVIKGYTGEGFLSQGKKLGGKRVPLDELRRQARAAAEKRRTLTKGSGKRLGGATPQTSRRAGNVDIRKVIADAATRRATITKGCVSGTKEGRKIADEASRNGFRTKAEEDDANDAAIAQALAELMEEEEMMRLGGHDPASPAGNGYDVPDGLTWSSEAGLQAIPPVSSTKGHVPLSNGDTPLVVHRWKPPTPTATAQPKQTQPASRNDRPISRLVLEADPKRPTPSTTSSLGSTPSLKSPSNTRPSSSSRSASAPVAQTWTCTICTLENPPTYLCCGACETERPESTLIDLTDEPIRHSPPKRQIPGWNCGRCGSFMERQWWTCSACGLMKASS